MSKEKVVKIGLGEAVSRLLKLELTRRNGLHPMPEIARKERDLLFDALNEIKIDLGFDCDGDGTPDTVEIFEQSAKDDCCRIIPTNPASEKQKSKKRRSSRRK
jgi:hypothetical protein